MAFFVLALSGCSSTIDNVKKDQIAKDAQVAKTAFINSSTNLDELFQKSEGYAIFPNVGKGAMVAGGASGNGAVYQKGNLIGYAKLKQVDIGFQLGGQAFRQVILFQTTKELERFKNGNFELSGNASAVAMDDGVAKSVEFRDGLAIATMPKAGAMIEVSVGGQKFEYIPLN
ncbi:hypothetical protein DHD80_14980 [Gramella sp. AN32]|nr:hypothetical protein [Gramella sp. AN32]